MDGATQGGGADILAAMSLKSASLLAMIGTLLMTLLVAVHFFNTTLGVVGGIVPAVAIVPCVVYLFGGITTTVFFWVFRRSQG